MNLSSASEEEFSCSDDHLSRNSVTHDAWEIYKDFRYGSPIVAAILIVFFTVAFTSNLFIIVSMLWQQMLRQPAQILLINLAVSDLLVSALVMPFTITSGIAREFIFGSSDSTRCKVCQTGIIFILLSQVSFHTLAFLSLDRFLFIRFPLRYKRIVTVRKTLAIVLAIWVLCVLLSIPPLFGFGEVKLSTSVGNCFISFFGKTSVTKNIFYLIFLVIEALFPLGILVVTNVWLLCIVVRHIREKLQRRENLNNQQPRQDTLRSRQQVQLVKVFGAIFIANVITWLPAILLAVSAPFVDFDHVPAEVIAFVYLTYISHTVIHPLLESCFIQKLRRLITQYVCCRGSSPAIEHTESHRRGSTDSSRRGSIRQVADSLSVNIRQEKEGRGGSGWKWRVSCCVCMLLDMCTAILLSDSEGGEDGTSSAQGALSPTPTELSIVSPFTEVPVANGRIA